MAKISLGTYFNQNFKMPSLYRDDLEDIEKLIRRELDPRKYRIAFGGYEYEGIEEIPAKAETAPVFVIYTVDPDIRIKFARSWAEMYVPQNSDKIDGGIRRLAQVIAKTERQWLWMATQYTSWLAPLIGFGLMTVAVFLCGNNIIDPSYLYLAIAGFELAIIWWVGSVFFRYYRFSEIQIQKRRKPSKKGLSIEQPIAMFFAGLVMGGVILWLVFNFLHHA